MQNNFVPLITKNGYSAIDMHNIIADRDVCIWGCGLAGRLVLRQLRLMGIAVRFFCDRKSISEFDGIYVISIDEAMKLAKEDKLFIIISSIPFCHEMVKYSLSMGLIKGIHFETYIQVRRPEAAISVSGCCKLFCSSCPVGRTRCNDSERYMHLDKFKIIFNKLLREEPLLSMVDLSLWGEPLLNPDLPEILCITGKANVPTILSTALHETTNLNKIINAAPFQFVVSVAGIGATYEKFFPGARWNDFLKNLELLAELSKKSDYQQRVVINFLSFTDNMGDDFQYFREICQEYGFKLHKTLGYPCEYDKLLEYCSSERKFTCRIKTDNLVWDLDQALNCSLNERSKPCRCQRIFPVINWDGSVALCHTFYQPIVADNFMNYSLKELIDMRHKMLFCRNCQKYGLHRLDVEMQIHQNNGKNILKKGLPL